MKFMSEKEKSSQLQSMMSECKTNLGCSTSIYGHVLVMVVGFGACTFLDRRLGGIKLLSLAMYKNVG